MAGEIGCLFDFGMMPRDFATYPGISKFLTGCINRSI